MILPQFHTFLEFLIELPRSYNIQTQLILQERKVDNFLPQPLRFYQRCNKEKYMLQCKYHNR